MTEQYGGWSSPDGRRASAAPDAPTAPASSPPPPDPTQFRPPPGWGGPTAAPGGWGAPRPAELRPGVIPLRPLGLGELLDGAVSLVRRYPRPALGFSAGVALVATVLNLALTLTAFRPLLTLDTTTLDSGDLSQLEGALGGAAVGGLGAAAISALATLVLTGVMTAIAGRAVLGQPMTVADAWAEVRPAIGRLIGIAVLTALLVYGTLVLAGVALTGLALAAGPVGLVLVVPLGIAAVVGAVYLYGRLALAPAVALLEKAGVRTSLKRSGVLVRRSWWRVMGILVLTVLIAGFVGQIVQAPFLLVGALPTGFGSLFDPAGTNTRILVVSAIGGGVAQTVVAPFTAGVRALLYVDRRMRAEGLDVALTAAAHQSAPQHTA